MFNKWIKGVTLAVALSAVMVPAAFADGGTTVTVDPGTLSFTTPAVPSDFSAGNIGTNTTAGLSSFSVSDYTGSGDGWQVTAQATQFAQWDPSLNGGLGGYVPSGNTLTASSLTMSPTVAAHSGTTSAPPVVASGPFVLDGASAADIADAAPGAGMGVYDFSASTLTLSLHAEDLVGTYHSDVTFDVAPPL